jgi:hypothetical protein
MIWHIRLALLALSQAVSQAYSARVSLHFCAWFTPSNLPVLSIRPPQDCAPPAAESAWMMLDGAELGLGTLLQQLCEPWQQGSRQQGSRRHADSHSTHGTHGRQHADWRMTAGADGKFHLAPTRFSNRDAVQQAEAFLGQNPKEQVRPAPADGKASTGSGAAGTSRRYRVVHHPRVAIRANPTTTARMIGVALAGSEVEAAEVVEPWLRLTEACWIRLTGRMMAGSEAWMLIDGHKLGLGPLLEPAG